MLCVPLRMPPYSCSAINLSRENTLADSSDFVDVSTPIPRRIHGLRMIKRCGISCLTASRAEKAVLFKARDAAKGTCLSLREKGRLMRVLFLLYKVKGRQKNHCGLFIAVRTGITEGKSKNGNKKRSLYYGFPLRYMK